jgi:hypothetical protein
VKEFYDSLKAALPLMLGYRYQSQLLSKFVNKAGKSVVDYEDADNNVVMKSLPVMDIENLSTLFNASFSGGNFYSGKKFPYDQCVIDLNPTNRQDLPDSKFPMTLQSELEVNVDNEYKTSKLVLTRVDAISGNKSDTFEMGSRSTDY